MAKAGADKGGDELPPDILKLSFEEAMRGLEEIVQRLEGGDVNLEDSIEIYTRGTQLKRHCEAKLRAAQERVDKIVADAEGAVKAIQAQEE
jgi:exodeoxyribonuclease VII small subunit